mgnify:CR=1 FL=1
MTQAAVPEAMATEKAVIDDTTVDGAPVADTHASTEAHGGEAHAAPAALGMDATMWVALAMLLVIGLAIWKKVPAMIGAALDKQIAGVIDSGACPLEPTTVVDLSGDAPEVLRRGRGDPAVLGL